MRIAFYSPTGANGIATYVRHMAAAIRGLHGDHRVLVLTDTKADGIMDLPRPSWLQIKRYGWAGAHAVNAFSYAKQWGADVFEVEESFGWSRHMKGIPVVVRLHCPNIFHPDDHNPAREKAEMDALKRAKAITAPTTELTDAMEEQYGFRLPATVIPNPQPEVWPRWSAEKADPNQILFVGRIDRTKGYDIALEAFAKARQSRPELKLVMVGPGELDAPEGATFLGYQTPEQINGLRLQSSLQICPSRFENFPYSLTEAMAMGLPVLSTMTFGGKAIIRDGVDGRLFGDSNEAARIMLEMLDDPQRYSWPAIERVRHYLSPGRIAEETVGLYRSLTPGRSAGWGAHGERASPGVDRRLIAGAL